MPLTVFNDMRVPGEPQMQLRTEYCQQMQRWRMWITLGPPMLIDDTGDRAQPIMYMWVGTWVTDEKKPLSKGLFAFFGGETGIRTPDRL